VLGRHRGYDSGRLGVRHRPQHPLPDIRVRRAHRLGSHPRFVRGQDLGGRIGIDPAHQGGQRVCVEAVYSGKVRCIAWRELRDTSLWRQGWV
jgi:hypothetical protein